VGGPLSVVETARLIGRLPALEHLDEFAALMAQPRVAETMWPGDLGGPRTREQSEAWLRKDIAHWEAHDFGVWHAFERSTDELVGRIGARATLVDGAMEVELAWIVHPDHWGQGYAAELAAAGRDLAFSRGLSSVVAMTLHDNERSRRVMDKLGMTYEADVTHAGLPHVLYRLRRA
jgi:[ribosomal protein S5]-alanine N-acetyltransferase